MKYVLFIIALVLDSFAIMLLKFIDLGLSSVSTVPNTISILTGKSIALYIFIITFIYILLQLILKKNFKDIKVYGQIIIAILSSLFVYCFEHLLQNIILPGIFIRIILLLISILLLSLAFRILVNISLLVHPKQGIVSTLSNLLKLKKGTTKFLFDVFHLLISVLLFIIASHSIQGIGIGTIICMLLIGPLINILNKISIINNIKGE